MRRSKSKTQSKRKPVAQDTGRSDFIYEFVLWEIGNKLVFLSVVTLSLTEKYGFKSTPWKPPAIIVKNLENLNEDSVLMDTDLDELNPVADPTTAGKSDDITMTDIIEKSKKVNPDDNMELSPESTAANAGEMVVDSSNEFHASQPLFDDDTEDFEFVMFARRDTVAAEQPIKLESQPLNNGNCDMKSPKQHFSEKIASDDANDYYSSVKKNEHQLDPMPHTSQLTGKIDDEDFAIKLCRLKTTDEMIDYVQEQTTRVDQLMEELFSMR